MDQLSTKLTSIVEKYLENSQPVEVAKTLVIVNKELYKIEEEARRLRLTGELDPDIYTALRKVYRDIVNRIMRLSYDYKLAHEVSVLHKALKFSSDTAGIYLQEYLRNTELK